MEKAKMLICSDIDNTLLRRDKSIPEENIEAVSRAVSEGAAFCLVSGRSAPSTRAYTEKLGVHGPISSLGGCLLQDEDGNIIEEHSIPVEAALYACSIYRRMPGISFFVYKRERWFTDFAMCDRTMEGWESHETLVQGEDAGDLENLIRRIHPNKVLATSFDSALLARFKKEFDSKPHPGAAAILSTAIYLEIMPSEADKGSAVKALARHYGVPRDKVLACGDYYNDLAMLKAAGSSALMANAPDDMKSQADYVTENDCDNGGLAEAISHFMGWKQLSNGMEK